MTSEKKSFLLVLLQEAIDEAVSESSRVSEIVDEMKRSGYDLCLVLESTVSICPSQDHQPDGVPEPRLASNGELNLTDHDLAFLQEMNIAVEA
jgi:hypothetical protein